MYENQINDLISNCKKQYDMLQSLMGACPSASLENCTEIAQAVTSEGDGTMYKRIRVCIGHNDDGSPILKQVGAYNEIELCDKIVNTILNSERRSEFISGGFSISKDIPTFKTYADDWISTYKEGKRKETTIKGYRSILNGHFYPEWANIPINEIDVRVIQSFLDDREHLSQKYQREMLVLLRQILECAYRDGLINVNTAKDTRIEYTSTKGMAREALTIQELTDIISHLGTLQPPDRLLLALFIYTGSRRGEILGLRWSDIDFENGLIHISQNATYAKNQAHIGTTKTESGKRDTPMLNALKPYLQAAFTGIDNPDAYVIGNGLKPISLTTFRRSWNRIADAIDLHGATSHIFRHTAATLLNYLNVDAKTIGAFIGDKDTKTIQNRYVHAVDLKTQAAANQLNDLLKQGA